MAGGSFWRGLATLTVVAGATVGYFYYTGQPAPYPLSEIPFLKERTAAVAAAAQASAPQAGQPGARPGSPNAAGPGGGRPPVPILVAKAERKDVPVRLDALGTVQTVASVTLRARVESQIREVAFEDGASVNAGDVLFRLDSRQIEAQIRQAEANLARDKAQLAVNEADLKRAQELARRDFASEQRLDQARAVAEAQRAVVRATEANIENLKVQLSFHTITAPIAGRIGAAGIKAGNIAKTGDGSPPLAIINQISPVYVAFSVPQRYLLDLKNAIADSSAFVIATPQGLQREARGRVAFVDNLVDAQTGMISTRAVFDNADELLWPGALTNVRITLRTERNVVVVPREAVQIGQTGTFVFVVDGETARVRPVTVARTTESVAVIARGLEGTETVVTEGQMLLTNGARVSIRQPGGGQRSPSAPSAQQQRPTQG